MAPVARRSALLLKVDEPPAVAIPHLKPELPSLQDVARVLPVKRRRSALAPKADAEATPAVPLPPPKVESPDVVMVSDDAAPVAAVPATAVNYSELSVTQLQTFWHANKQSPDGVKSDSVARCVAGELHGVLPTCPQCEMVALGIDEHGHLKCPGYRDGAAQLMVRCRYKAPQSAVPRKPWIMAQVGAPAGRDDDEAAAQQASPPAELLSGSHDDDAALVKKLNAKTVVKLHAELRHNQQVLGKDKADTIARIIGGRRNGGFPYCTSCIHGRIKIGWGGKYWCPGYYDDDGKQVECGVTAELSDIDRIPWKVPR